MLNMVGATHVGTRDHNEDCFVAEEDLGFALVADGMGGYACGEVASAIVKNTLLSAVKNNEGLVEAIGRAHASIREEAQTDDSKKGMGTTVVAFKSVDSDYEIAWVGDSRAYLWDGQLKQLTRDHSYVEMLLSSGAISENDLHQHPQKNLITQAVGTAASGGLEIGLIAGCLGPGEQLILCSDGLVDEISEQQLAVIINGLSSPSKTVEQLINAALAAGGHDNITVVIISADNGSGAQSCHADPVCTTSLNGVSTRHDIMPSQTAAKQYVEMSAISPLWAGAAVLMLLVVVSYNILF